jgi:hypothetical protein
MVTAQELSTITTNASADAAAAGVFLKLGRTDNGMVLLTKALLRYQGLVQRLVSEGIDTTDPQVQDYVERTAPTTAILAERLAALDGVLPSFTDFAANHLGE